MTTLLNATITTAVTASVTTGTQLGTIRSRNPQSAVIQGALTYGSGGTTARAWVQTSIDGGVTWIDVADFSFTTSSARFIYNLSAQTPVTTQYTATDGTLSANTSKDGILGQTWRVKYTTTGTYAGSTTLRIDVIARGTS